MTKVGFISLGCPKNLVDSEVMMGQLKQKGYEITANAEEADTVVLELGSFDRADHGIIVTLAAHRCGADSCQQAPDTSYPSVFDA